MSSHPPLDLKRLTTDAAALLKQVAVAEILPRFRNLSTNEAERKVNKDDPDDVVTVVDRRVEARLTEELQRLLAGSVVVGEEACAADPSWLTKTASERLVWVLDPLDGTRNFVDGNESFGAMLALLVDGLTVLSAIYLPMSDELYTATRGGGARCNDETFAADPNSRDSRILMLHTKFIRDPQFRRTIEGRSQSASVMPPAGSAAVAYTDLVRQRYDGAFYARMLPWDHAPGILLLEECGGKAADLDGKAYTPQTTYGHFLAAASPARWEELQAMLIATDPPNA